MRRRRAPSVVLRYLLLGVVGAALPWLDVVVLLAALTSLTVLVALLSRHERSLLTPLGPLLLATMTSVTLPALTGHLAGTPRFAISHAHYVRAVFATFVFVALAVGVYLITRRHRHFRGGRRELLSPPALSGSLAVWIGTVCIGGIVLLLAMSAVGGFGAYFSSLANRRVEFAGKGWVSWGLVIPSTASLLVVANAKRLRARHGPVFSAAVLAVAVAVSLGLAFLTGNRMNLVAYLAELAVVVHLFVRPLRVRHSLAGVVVVAAVALALPSILRPASGEAEFKARSLAAAYEDIDTHGPVGDFGQLPGAALVMVDRGPALLGRSYLAALTYGIPRALAPWKLPDAGEYATKRILPARWSRSGTGFQISAVGEAYLNFGFAGVVVLGAAAGFAMGRLRRLLEGEGWFAGLAFAVLLPRVALYYRGGFANVTGYLLMELSVLLVARAVMKERQRAVVEAPCVPSLVR